MLSRVANAIYWMARYIERAENVARFISVNLNLNLDLPDTSARQWWPLVVTTGDDQQFLRGKEDYTRESVIDFLAFDETNSNSIATCLANARENARSIREVISGEMWQHINNVYLMVEDSGGLTAVLEDPHRFFSQVALVSQYFLGITDATMAHGEGWHFCHLGAMLERADKTSRILDVRYFLLLPTRGEEAPAYEGIQWLALLRSAVALQMYRQRFGAVSPEHVVQFLVLDREFPRAILYCLTQADVALHGIGGSPLGDFDNAAEMQLGRLRAELAYTTADVMIRRGLHDYIDHLQCHLNHVGDAVHEVFFDMKKAADFPQ